MTAVWLSWYRLRYRLRRHREPLSGVYAEMRLSLERLIRETEGRPPNRETPPPRGPGGGVC